MKLPRAHKRRIDALADLSDVNRWASDVDLELQQIIDSLKQTQDRLQVTIVGNRRTRLAPHAEQHRPHGSDPIPTGPGTTLSATTVNGVGSGNFLARADHTHALLTAAPSGGYSTAGAVGVGADLMRASAVLPYPDKLMSPTGELLAFTDDPSEGAYLSTSGSFLQNAFGILAPGATNALRIGKFGNLAIGGASLADVTLLSLVKTDYSESSNIPSGWACTLTNKHTGTATAAVRGIFGSITATMADAGGVSTNPAIGANLSVTGGALTNNNFQGTVRGFQTTLSVSAATVGTPAALLEGYRVGGSVNRNALTDFVGYRMVTPTVGFSGTITNVYGLLVDSIGTGTNRWTAKGSNKYECASSDFVNTTAGKGLVNKDTQATAEFWRLYVGATGLKDATYTMDDTEVVIVARGGSATGTVVLNMQDIGTTAPLT